VSAIYSLHNGTYTTLHNSIMQHTVAYESHTKIPQMNAHNRHITAQHGILRAFSL